ncbi:MAG: hypothetical protein KC506_00265 [Nanoarchaeota archaeon]|nr:hypothetical protein [Nanoarchaeota archaeon]
MTITTQTIIETDFGKFKVSFHKSKKSSCISFSYGDLKKGNPIIRIHSACLFGEAFHSRHCDCFHQLTATMKRIKEHGCGVIVYSYNEGRGIGIENKIKSMELERTKKVDTVEAFKLLGFDRPDYRDYKIEVNSLIELGVSKGIQTFTGNPAKLKSLRDGGFKVEKIYSDKPLKLTKLARSERETKEKKMGYDY